MSKKRRSDKEIILEIVELYLQLVENEMEIKPFSDSAIFKHDDEQIREMFKKHIADDIEEEIRSSDQYLNLKVVLMSQDNREKMERTIKTFLEMLDKKGIAIDIESEKMMRYLEKQIVKHMKRRR